MDLVLLALLQLFPQNSPLVQGPGGYANLARETCEPKAISDYDIMVCAHHEFAAADRELNITYGKVLAATRGKSDPNPSYDIPDASRLVVVAQKAWLAMRDAHCSAIGVALSEGQSRAAAEFSCMAGLTRERTAQLKELLERFTIDGK